ncbi:hypothetical protein DM02DRAFT_497350, partial [Periconia macrospinosa]
LFASMSSAKELNAADIPTACTTICQPIVQLTNTCDINMKKREAKPARKGSKELAESVLETQCICRNKSFNVASISALCAGCIQQNDMGKSNVDMDSIMSTCSFSSTSYAPTATALVATITVNATKPA